MTGKKLDVAIIEKRYCVMATDKKTKEKTMLERDMTRKQAESFCEAWGWNYCDELGKSYWLSFEFQTLYPLSEKAQKVWKVAVKYALTESVESCIDDLEAFAENINCDDEGEVLDAIYNRLTMMY